MFYTLNCRYRIWIVRSRTIFSDKMNATYVAILGAHKPIAPMTSLNPPSPLFAMIISSRKMNKKNFISISVFLQQMRKPRVILTRSPSAAFSSHHTIIYYYSISMFVLLFQLACAKYPPRRLMTKISIVTNILEL